MMDDDDDGDSDDGDGDEGDDESEISPEQRYHMEVCSPILYGLPCRMKG